MRAVACAAVLHAVAEVSAQLIAVTSGTQYCTVSNDCVSSVVDAGGLYGNDEACTVTANGAVTISSTLIARVQCSATSAICVARFVLLFYTVSALHATSCGNSLAFVVVVEN